MRLVLREYLSMLKESGELDVLLVDLLIAMGIEPLSRPVVGIRQFGVDLSAVGEDLDDNGARKLFLFVIKQGDITRSAWSSDLQAVRPTLEEVLDVYLGNHVRPEHAQLPVKIVVATNGEIKQDVELNWTGFTNKHTVPHQLEFSFWGADQIAGYLDRHLLEEHLFPESAQKQIRKTIALADQNDEEPRHFYAFLEDLLFHRDLPIEQTASAVRRRRKALLLLRLSVDLIFHWCKEADNLRPALLCAERALLQAWDWLRQRRLFDGPESAAFRALLNTYLAISLSLMEKLKPVCRVRDGFFAHAPDKYEYRIFTFDAIGILSNIVLYTTQIRLNLNDNLDPESTSRLLQIGEEAAETLSQLIQNNPAANSPCFDGQSIEIGLALYALSSLGYRQVAVDWLSLLWNRVVFAFHFGQHFPISSDSYDDLMALRFDEGSLREELANLSTLLPTLADWFAVLNLPDEYSDFRGAVERHLAKTNLQMWFADEHTEGVLYQTHAGHASELMLSYQLPESLEGIRDRMGRLLERSSFGQLSCVQRGWSFLCLIASRHFRTPMMPEFWQALVCGTEKIPWHVDTTHNQGADLEGEAAGLEV